MFQAPKALSRRNSPRGLEYVAMILNAATDMVSWRSLVTAAAGFFLLHSAALRTVERWAPGTPSASAGETTATDPVLAEIGTTVLRVSDVRAHAGRSGDPALLAASAFAPTTVMDALADEAILAEAAVADGIDQALEIQAMVAQARRQILAEAYLERVIRHQVTDDAVKAAYLSALADAEASQDVSIRQIVVASEVEASSLRQRIQSGASFDEMARRRSLDMASRGAGGDLGIRRLHELPGNIAHVAKHLAIGDVSAPLKTDHGWVLVTVDARKATRLPEFADIEPALRQKLRLAAIESAIASARMDVPVREATEAAPAALILPTTAALGSVW